MICKRDHVWRLFRSSPLVLSLTTAVVVLLSGSDSMWLNVKLESLLHRFGHPTSQQDILSSLCSRICAVLNWPPPIFALFCLHLAQWRNCDVGAKCLFKESWDKMVSTKILSSTTVFNIDNKQKYYLIHILEWFLKNRVTLKTEIMMLKIQLWSQQ